MKTINIREFCLRPASYLKELPITLTRYDKPVASIIPIGNIKISNEVLKEKDLVPKPHAPTPPPHSAVIVDNVEKPKIFWFGGKKYEVDEFGNEKEVK